MKVQINHICALLPSQLGLCNPALKLAVTFLNLPKLRYYKIKKTRQCRIHFRASGYFECLCLQISIIVISGDFKFKLVFDKFSRTLNKFHSITYFGFVCTFRCSSFPGIWICLYVHHRTSRSKASITDLVARSKAHYKTSRNFDV